MEMIILKGLNLDTFYCICNSILLILNCSKRSMKVETEEFPKKNSDKANLY
jgi:hypothetical protein